MAEPLVPEDRSISVGSLRIRAMSLLGTLVAVAAIVGNGRFW